MADFVNVSLKVDFSEIDEFLDNLDDRATRKQIIKYVLSNVTRITTNKIKKDYNLYLHKKTGNLYRNIKYKVYRRGTSSHIMSYAKSDNNVGYPFVLAAGVEIKPKKEDGYLTFQIDGKWIRKHSVTIPEHNFLEAPAKKYLNSSEMKKDMDFYLQKKIDQLEKKGVVERYTEK